MGTHLTQQKRGHGGPSYRSPGHRFFGHISYVLPKKTMRGQVMRFIDDPGRRTLLAEILLEDGSKIYSLAAEGLLVGAEVSVGPEAQATLGSITRLNNIPEGTPIFNLELTPGDGGRVSRSSGAVSYRLAQDEDSQKVTVQLSSKEIRELKPNCYATIGVAAGGGSKEKPFLKAGTKSHVMHALNRYYPHVRGRAMSAYDHPYGGKTGGKPTTVSRGTPPGRKAGHIAARRTGRSAGKKKSETGTSVN
ncbi:MAG: 50S ribosomal protein L2 [Candidatus Micrarchaeota archaeon]